MTTIEPKSADGKLGFSTRKTVCPFQFTLGLKGDGKPELEAETALFPEERL